MNFKIQRLFNLPFFSIGFVSWVGGKLRFRLSLSPSKLKVKKHPMRASLFSINPLFGPQGISFLYLAAGKRLLVLTSLPPLLPSTLSFRKPSSQLSLGLYVSASGMCCDTCVPMDTSVSCCTVAPPITHVCVAFPGEGRGSVSSPLPVVNECC